MRLEAHLAAGTWRDADVTAIQSKAFSGDSASNRSSLDGIVLGRALQQGDQRRIQQFFDQHAGPLDSFRRLVAPGVDRTIALSGLRRLADDPTLQARPLQMYSWRNSLLSGAIPSCP